MIKDDFSVKRNLIFMGTPSFVVPVLQSLSNFDWNIIVYTAPDRPSGRGKKLKQSDVKIAALDLGFHVKQPESFLKNPKSVNEILEFCPDLIIVAGYGPIIDQKIVSIDQSDRNDTLTEKLFLMGSDLLKDYLMNYENNLKTPSLQDDSKAVYTALVVKQDGKLDFSRGAAFLERQVRAYDPWPGTYANFNNGILKILNAKVMRLSNKDLLHLKDLIAGSIIRLDEFEDIGYIESEKFYKVSKAISIANFALPRGPLM